MSNVIYARGTYAEAIYIDGKKISQTRNISTDDILASLAFRQVTVNSYQEVWLDSSKERLVAEDEGRFPDEFADLGFVWIRGVWR